TNVGVPEKVPLCAPSGEQIDVVPLFASRNEFISFFDEKVRDWKDTDSVILLWTGHGVVDTFDQRYLLLADSRERGLTCIAVGTLRRLFRAQDYPPFSSVLSVIDSCAQPMDIRPDDLPIQTDRPAARKRPQYFLFSTSVGQLSTFVAPHSEKPSFAQ